MKKIVLLLFILLLTFFISSFSYAVTYDMNSMTPGYYTESTFNNAFLGVSFNNTGGDGFDILQNSMYGSNLEPDFSGNVVWNNPYYTMNNSTIATFSVPVFSVSVTLGDYNRDSDLLNLFAYDENGAEIGNVSFENPESSYAGTTLSISSSTAIAYVEFYGEGLLENSVAWDNFSFNEDAGSNNQSPVPEPATIFLLGAGLTGLAGVRKKNKK